MDRIALKAKAKELRDQHLKDFWVAYIILIGISTIAPILVKALCFKNAILYACLSIVVSVFESTVSIGFYAYLMKIVRKEEFNIQILFKYISKALPIFAIALLVGIICGLWSILFVVPGIIAALGYSMVYFIFVDNDEISPMDCLDASKKMMNGYKKDYFVFTLSFLGWIMLSVLTCGILLIWVLPYISFAQILYYEELKKKTN